MNKITLPSFDSVTRIVCLDIGDGGCSAFTCKIDNGIFGKTKPQLTFEIGNDRDAKTMPSVISYKINPETGELDLVCIGDLQASKGNENYVSVTNFKRNPVNDETNETEINWTGTPKAFNSENYKEFKKTYKECMKDFIGGLWENLKKNNSDDAEVLPRKLKNEETMIFAACPSSKIWMDQRDQYAKLISDATGIDEKHIYIFRESDVAAYRALKNADESLTLDHGVVVIDCGSSTLDFTYMEKGKIKKTLSWTLGAGMIEELMFEKMKMILERSDKQNERALLSYLETGKNRDFYLFDIRKDAKEVYFSPKEKGKKTYVDKTYYLTKENHKDGADFNVDDAFMNDVLSMPIGYRVMCDGKRALEEASWELGWVECFEEFLEACKTKLDGAQIDRVVLTGGASRMYFIRERCEKAFEGVEIDLDPHPYSCVSFGLSQLAHNMFNVEALIRKEVSKIENDSFEDVISACQRIRKKIDSYLIKKRDEAIACIREEEEVNFEQYYKSWELMDWLDAKMNELVSKESIENAIKNEVQEFRSVLDKRFQKVSERCSKALYGKESVGGVWKCDPDAKWFGIYEDKDAQIFPDNNFYFNFSTYYRLSFLEKLHRKMLLKEHRQYFEIGNQKENLTEEAVYRVGKLSDFQNDSDATQHAPRILKAINIPIPVPSYSFKTENEGFLADIYFERIKEIIMRVALLTDYQFDISLGSSKPSSRDSNSSYNEYVDYDPIRTWW